MQQFNTLGQLDRSIMKNYLFSYETVLQNPAIGAKPTKKLD
jgi:hypothetical protein